MTTTTPPNGAQRLVRIVCDIMIGDMFFATFRGNVPQKPHMGSQGECNWGCDVEDIAAAILVRYPSLTRKKFTVCL